MKIGSLSAAWSADPLEKVLDFFAESGLQAGDRILSVAAPGRTAKAVRYFTDLRELVSPHPGEPLRFEVERDGRRLAPLTIVPGAIAGHFGRVAHGHICTIDISAMLLCPSAAPIPWSPLSQTL